MTLHIKTKNYHTKQCNAPIDYSTNQESKLLDYHSLGADWSGYGVQQLLALLKVVVQITDLSKPITHFNCKFIKKKLQDNNFNEKRKKPQLNNTNDSDCWSLVPFSMVSANFSTNCIIKSITSKNQQHFILIRICVRMHLCL